MKSWRVYILRCRDDSLYTGVTNDLGRRLDSHQRGSASRYTRARLPVTLVHDEPAASRGDALRREASIKRLSRADKLALARGRRAR
jgi:putative endonuclease